MTGTSGSVPVRSTRSPADWSLRTKLAVVLLVPAVLAVIVGGLRIGDQVGQVRDLDRVSRFAAAQADLAELGRALEVERLRATAFVAGDRRGDPGMLDAAQRDVDTAASGALAGLAAVGGDDPALEDADGRAQQTLARLPGLRTLVTSSNAPPSAVVTRYSELTAALGQLEDLALRGIDAGPVIGLAAALGGLGRARDEVLLQQALLQPRVLERSPGQVDTLELQASEGRLDQGLADFRTALDAAGRVAWAGLIAGPENTARAALVGTALARPDRIATELGDATSAPVYAGVLARIDSAENDVRAGLTTTAAELRHTAVLTAVQSSVLLLVALAIATLVVVWLARQMIGSLRMLRAGALAVAHRDLPETVRTMRTGAVPALPVAPVPVHTREEIGEVARAFDAVHEQAVRLAAEQATLQGNVNAMVTNMSRRSQVLVDTQLQLIERLESDEQDPDQLESLFRLDHLATRMRRIGENVLVLAGSDRAPAGGPAVSVGLVLQAAVSEVDQYRRVVILRRPDLAVLGHVARDLQHLLAELLDNAAQFSPPETQVLVSASAATGGVLLVDVLDAGVGLSEEDLARVNTRLAEPPEVTVESSRRMGLVVVGTLASRHGIRVALRRRTDLPEGATGTAARIIVPAGLLRQPEPASEPAVPVMPPAPVHRRGPVVPPQVPAARTAAAPEAEPGAGELFGGASPTFWRMTPAAAQRALRVPAPVDPIPPAAPVPDAAPEPTPIFDDVASSWFSAEDDTPFDGGRGATAFADGVRAADDLARSAAGEPATGAGLPRRTPGARLLPGTLDVPAEDPARGTTGSPVGRIPRPRDADSVRDRLDSLRRGAVHPDTPDGRR